MKTNILILIISIISLLILSHLNPDSIIDNNPSNINNTSMSVIVQ
ncbi:MAG: hypothetical protein AB1782_09865 [Cyanobacteriota bacterium]